METIHGSWFPDGGARRLDAGMRLFEGGYILSVEGEPDRQGASADLTISDRVGNIQRRISLPGEWMFETTENDAVDRWLESDHSTPSGSAWIHRLESRWRWILSALVVTVAVVAAGGYWGIPWFSRVAAAHMPESVIQSVSSGTLELLDEWLLDPSELPASRRDELTAAFQGLLGEEEADGYRLHFRQLGVPNAFALPSGDIIVTDEFTKLADGVEFDAVMLHEIGHVELRHGMQQLVRSSLVSFLVAVYLGDPSGVEELVVALPLFLVQSHYSRAHEREADDYALRAMMDRGMDPAYFASIMEKLEQFHHDGSESTDGRGEEHDSALDFLSSHPATSDRIRRARELSEEFRQRR